MIDFSRNHFELFGLAPRFRIDGPALDRAYRTLQGEVHPDRFAAATEEEQRRSLQASSRVNDAYRTLKDPVLRAEYLISLHTRADVDSDRVLPVDFLEQQLERRERASDAADAEDSVALDALLAEVREDVRVRDGTLASLIDAEQAWDEARLRVRELKFLSKFADDIDNMVVALEA